MERLRESRPDIEDLNDRSWLVVDNTTGSPCYGDIYMTWYDYNVGRQRVARSADGCATWSNLTNLGLDLSPDMAVGPDGQVYVVWRQGNPLTFKIGSSTNCGVSWSSRNLRVALGGGWTTIPAQCTRGVWAQPAVDVDRALGSRFFGRVYVAMFDLSAPGCGQGPGCGNWSSACNFDVWFMYSDDQGQSWSGPVNLTAGDGTQVDHFLGSMRVDEADGSVYLACHRSRLNPASLLDRQRTHFFVTRSTDGGQSWEPTFQASTLEGDECAAGAYSFERGDHNWLDVHQGVAWPAWVDRRGGAGEEEVVVPQAVLGASALERALAHLRSADPCGRVLRPGRPGLVLGCS